MKKYDKESRARRLRARKIGRTVSATISGLAFLVALGIVGASETGTTLTLGAFFKALGCLAVMVLTAWYAGGFDYILRVKED